MNGMETMAMFGIVVAEESFWSPMYPSTRPGSSGGGGGGGARGHSVMGYYPEEHIMQPDSEHFFA